MSDVGGVLIFVLGFAACVVALTGIVTSAVGPSFPDRESLTDRWRKLTKMLPK